MNTGSSCSSTATFCSGYCGGIFGQLYYLWGPQILVLCGFRSKGIPARLNKLMRYYPIATLIYCLLFGHRILFAILTSYTVAYNLTKFTAKEYGYV
ncbi:hypothetical protein MSIMFB_04564 [Mycobacterium simulans]|uniref:Uncharacterized protein n=1 Tax=Mycobacterium simulans TaxID=627089 RepID=A0A7Z7INV8_9MYCO|nr:hypothetical protein MSIMFB_04564 [Mycobacterium simulans]